MHLRLTRFARAAALVAAGVAMAVAAPAAAEDAVTEDVLDEKVGELEDALYEEIENLQEEAKILKRRTIDEERARIALAGRPLFLRHCAECHGRDGDGNGPAARFFDIPPRDFTRGEYQFRMTPSGKLPRELDLYRTITVGVLGTPMPPWGRVLTEGQRRLLAKYLMTLSPRFAGLKPAEPIVIGPEPEMTPDSIKRGQEVYVEMKCAQCHGAGGRGDGVGAATTKDDWGNRVLPYDLTLPYFQGGVGASVIYRAMSTGLSGTPMPSYADTLPPEDRWALAHYILSLADRSAVFDYLFLAPAGRYTTP